jgi:hypothetical protein
VVDPTAVDGTLKQAISAIQDYLLTLPIIPTHLIGKAMIESVVSKHAQTGHQKPKKQAANTQYPLNVMMASPANCPMFFLGS